MNWVSTDKPSLIIHDQWNEGVLKEIVNGLNSRTKEVIESVENETSLYDYLKENIYG